MVKYVKCFISDSTDFLIHLPKTVSPHSNLVSFDIENLHSNIPHELGLETIDFWPNKHPEDIARSIDKDFIKRRIKFINNFYLMATIISK